MTENQTPLEELTESTAENNATAEISTPAESTPKTSKSKTKAAQPAEEFDWEMDGAGFGTYDGGSKNAMTEMYAKTFNVVNEGELVKGRVVAISDKDVVLNIGFKSDGLIARSEFRDMPELAVGDEVEVMVENKEDKNGQLILSRKKAIGERAWENIKEAFDNDVVVEGYVKTRTKGGLVVDVLGMEAFLPGSQIDIKPIRDYDVYVGQTLQFKIVKLNEIFKNVVISHKALIEDDIEAQKSDILGKLEKGQVLEGVVKNMTSFGVFVDLGGVDGLLHITDISWGRINHPEEVLKLDDKINVVVLDFDDDKKRISLGLKQLTAHPWEALAEELKEGAKVKGKVVTVADYGAFLEIAPGIEGLIHVSEMSWSQHLRNPQDFLKVGDEIEAQILSIDKDERKMSLGLKQLLSDPWVNITDKYYIGSKHRGIVRNMTNYGLFVELEEGVDGLVHVSDLSWNKKIKHPNEFVKKDQELEVVVLEVDRDNRRLSLGHKQLEDNPWDTFETVFSVGTEHDATVMKYADKGATLALPYGLEGYAPIKQLQKEDKTNAKEDETIRVVVTEFSKDNRRIVVSHTKLWKDAEKQTKTEGETKAKKSDKGGSKSSKQMSQQVERSTFGELDVLSDLKAKMESSESKKASAKKAKEKAEENPEPKPETPDEGKSEA